MKYDFSKINPITGMPAIKKENPFHTMLQFPNRKCKIRFCDNNISPNTNGNVRYSVVYEYNPVNKTVIDNEGKTIHFNSVKLKDGRKARYWMYEK